MLAEVGATSSFAFSAWTGAAATVAVAAPLLGLGVKRLFDTYTKKDTVKLIDDAVAPLKDLVAANIENLTKVGEHLHRNEILLTEVKTKMENRRSSDGEG